MSYQILPNEIKKVGITLFLTFSFLDGGESFLNGFLGYPPSTDNFFALIKIFSGNTILFDILIIVGLLLYMFSKEKIEDDYIKILRYESYQLAIIISILIALALFIFSRDSTFNTESIITAYIMIYIIVFFFKKRWI